MQPELVKRLLDLNRTFYADFAGRFSETRSSERMNVEPFRPYLHNSTGVLDVGCGNGRLAARLDSEGYRIEYTGIDQSAALIETANEHMRQFHAVSATFITSDLANPLWLAPLKSERPFDLILALAVLHHLPGHDLRRRLLADLRSLVRPGGRVIMSNWQYQNSPRLLGKVVPWSRIGVADGEVDPGDALIDWRRGGEGLRYVHLVTKEEVLGLAQETGFLVREQFLADADLNLYGELERG